MMKFKFKVKNIEKISNHYDKFYKSLSNQVEKSLNKSAKTIQDNAKKTIIRNNNIITGNLLRSVTGEVLSERKYNVKAFFTLNAYSRIFYAIYVERRYPYLFPAYEHERVNIIKNLQKIARGK